jgi:hypothetical protein
MRGIRHGGLIAAATAALALTAATALAGTGSTASRVTTLTGNGPATVGATCPVATRATGAGFSIVDAYNPKTKTGTRSMVQSSARTATRSFKAVASMQAPNQPTTHFRSYVRCIKSTKGPAGYAVGDAMVNPGTIQVANASCPKAYKAIGGGFAADPAYAPPPGGKGIPFILESRRVGSQTWRSTLMNPAPFGQAPVKFTFWALCERDDNGATKVRSKTATIAPDSRRDVSTKCPRGWHTASGGFRLGPIADTDVLFGFIDRSRPQGSRTWRAGAWTLPASIEGEGGTVTVYAYCKHN